MIFPSLVVRPWEKLKNRESHGRIASRAFHKLLEIFQKVAQKLLEKTKTLFWSDAKNMQIIQQKYKDF